MKPPFYISIPEKKDIFTIFLYTVLVKLFKDLVIFTQPPSDVSDSSSRKIQMNNVTIFGTIQFIRTKCKTSRSFVVFVVCFPTKFFCFFLPPPPC